MLEVSLVLILGIVLLSLSIILIILFIKHLNFMYIFIEEIRETQILLHNEILEIKYNPKKTTKKDTKQKNKVNKQISDLKSSQVSEKELSELMKGKDLIFKEQVNVKSGDHFINRNIDF